MSAWGSLRTEASGAFVALAALALACSSAPGSQELPAVDDTCAGPCPASRIEHVVVVIQENHTFDNVFGRYCTAPAGSNPTCNDGPACCEAAPAQDASGHAPIVLDDAAQGFHDPDHTAACEATEMNGGAMDRYATAACGAPENVAVGDAATYGPYWDLAKTGALADRYFQPEIGQSSANDMYFARATHVFTDNAFEPKGAPGSACSLQSAQVAEYTDKTLGDVLDAAGVPWAFYAEGYAAQAAASAAGGCATRDPACPGDVNFSPCTYEPGDVPFEYFPNSRTRPGVMRDYDDFARDVRTGALPAVAFVKGLGYHTEHPGVRTTITDGVAFVSAIAREIATSRYREATLLLVVYDEGGGYWDHVAPPAAIDASPYGTRVPLLAVGPFVKRGYVSHGVLEHSSIVAFLEWNFAGSVGQLGTRDAKVRGLGDLLDPAATGATAP